MTEEKKLVDKSIGGFRWNKSISEEEEIIVFRYEDIESDLNRLKKKFKDAYRNRELSYSDIDIYFDNIIGDL